MDNKTQAVMSSVGGTLKSARTLVALQAERTALVTLTLPQAYAALGKAVYPGRQFHADFPELYAEMDRLSEEQSRLSESQGHAASSSGSLAGRAQQMLSNAKDAATATTLSVQVQRAATKLGEAVFGKHGGSSGDPAIVKPIADHVARLSRLDSEIASVSKSLKADGNHFLGKKRLLLIAGGVGLVALTAVVLLKGGRSLSSDGEQGAATVASLPSSAKAVEVALEHPDPRHGEHTVALRNYQNTVPQQNSYLRDLKCFKDDDGKLTFTFNLTGWHDGDVGRSHGWPMIVRLFDRNKQYLEHFTTQRFAEEGTIEADVQQSQNVGDLKKGANTLSFSVNMRDLRDTEYVEISFLDPGVWVKWFDDPRIYRLEKEKKDAAAKKGAAK